eukprot:9246360-Lingulodinium_polyedra.AAC.1
MASRCPCHFGSRHRDCLLLLPARPLPGAPAPAGSYCVTSGPVQTAHRRGKPPGSTPLFPAPASPEPPGAQAWAPVVLQTRLRAPS